MAKIDDLNYVLYPNEFVKKSDVKKTDKSKNKNPLKFKNNSNFEEILSSEIEDSEIDNIQTKEIEKILKDIGIQGEILKKSKNLDDLDIYKRMVKRFILNIVELSETAEKKVVWNKFKKEKITKIHLQIIDKELLDLARVFMSEQYNVLEVASKIDKIYGILVDLAT